MFQLPTPKDISHDGDSDEQPLFLEGVRKVDFRRLLKAMEFPAKSPASRSEGYYAFSHEELTMI
jgi:hypothetical protein